MSNNVYALIPARKHSTRLPNKSLLEINGKTIIRRVYESVLRTKLVDRIIVVTDDFNIKTEIDLHFGKENTIMILDECVNGTERIVRALSEIPNANIIVNVQGDEPFINPEHIDLAIEKYIGLNSKFNILTKPHNNICCVTLHHPLDTDYDIMDHSIVKMVLNKHDEVLYASRNVIPITKCGIISENYRYNGHIGMFVYSRWYLDEYLNNKDTCLQLIEDIEWLKPLELGYKIYSYGVDSSERGVNTMEDYLYLCDKFS